MHLVEGAGRPDDPPTGAAQDGLGLFAQRGGWMEPGAGIDDDREGGCARTA